MILYNHDFIMSPRFNNYNNNNRVKLINLKLITNYKSNEKII